MIEDALVKVGKFIFPADFLVLDIEKDHNISIILGWLFSATGRILIDVQKGELKLKVQDKQETFKVFKATKYPDGNGEVLHIDVIDLLTKPSSPLKKSHTTLQKKKALQETLERQKS